MRLFLTSCVVLAIDAAFALMSSGVISARVGLPSLAGIPPQSLLGAAGIVVLFVITCVSTLVTRKETKR